ncbi:MAG: LysM peptidoglycan-binding domain-containing protein [Burkholderiales bacterium]
MKKFSTAAAFLAFASFFLPQTGIAASSDGTDMNPGAVPGAAQCAFLENAPDQHTVVRGDTLWGISGQFLQHPWCWPQVWGVNRAQINDPHWIYPGQIVYLDRIAGRLRLGTPTGSTAVQANESGSFHLSPQVRTQNLTGDAIASIPTNVIEPYLSQPLVLNENDLNDNPRIMATDEGWVVIGKGDHAYVRGDLKGGTSFQIFRPGAPMKDPGTAKIIGYEAVYLGTAKLIRAAKTADEANVFTIVSAKEEIEVGDRLMPVTPQPLINYMPHPPAQPTTSRIVSIYEGLTHAGQNQIVSINRGKKDGIDIGTVLDLYRFGATVRDRTDHGKAVKLPDEQYGSLFVFRVFENISYGLIMEVRDSVRVGDVAKSPE